MKNRKFRLVINNFPKDISNRKLKAFRLIGGVKLKTALDTYKFARSMESLTLASGLEKDVVDYYVNVLSDAGFLVHSEECDDKFPMLFSPQLSQKLRWSIGRRITVSG